MKIQIRKYDYASVFCALVVLVSFLIRDYMHFKKSRIGIASMMSARECLQSLYWVFLALVCVLVVLCAVKKKAPRFNFWVGIYADLLMVTIILFSIKEASTIPEYTGAARLSFGIGLILTILCLYCVAVKTQEFMSLVWQKTLVSLLSWTIIAVFLVLGMLNEFSLVKELIAARSTFGANVMGHLKLSLSAVVFAILIGIPVGYKCYKSKPFNRKLMFTLSIIEVMPQLALFAVIRIPFTYLGKNVAFFKSMGVTGFGFAPAFTALLLYSLYLMIHNARAGFSCVDPNLIENGLAMGMTRRGVFWRVEIPVAFPLLLNGVRITVMSAIVGASLSGFVGAKSLGLYISNGINALSIDQQLLGVIPIFILAVIADMGFMIFIRRLSEKGHL